MVGWIRGYRVRDEVCFGDGEALLYHSLNFCRNGIRWEKHESDNNLGFMPWWHCQPPADATDVIQGWVIPIVIDWRWQSSGFDFGTFHDADQPEYQVKFWTIPYWSIVIPLTLISLWLLLPKPRGPTPKMISESIAYEKA